MRKLTGEIKKKILKFSGVFRGYKMGTLARNGLSEFHANFIKPVISELIDQIENAFGIPERLLEFSAIDPQAMPSNSLRKFGKQKIKRLSCFYGSNSLIYYGKKSVKFIVNATSLESQFDIFLKKIVVTKR